MSITARGKQNELVLVSVGKLSSNLNGDLEGVCTYECFPYERGVELIPQPNVARHPKYNHLYAQETEVSYKRGGVAVLTVRYKGRFYGSWAGGDEAREIYEILPTLDSIDIRRHPKFNQWAGTGDSPTPVAVWLRSGDAYEFIGFRKDPANPDNPLNVLAGMSSYLNPTSVFRRTYTTKTRPDLARVRTIVANPRGAPKVAPGFNWLLVALPHVKMGPEWRVTEEYMLSGPEGWSSLIYS